MVFAFDDGAGVHIGPDNLARVGGFFQRRAGTNIPFRARTATPDQPLLTSDLPPGARVGVLLVLGQPVGTDGDGRWRNRGWLDGLRTAHPRHQCRPAPVEGPQACLFTTAADTAVGTR